jgi:transposase-like protein
MAKSKRSAEKEEFWRMVLEEHRHSGLGVKAFCRQQDVSEALFYAWRRKIRNRDSELRQDQAAQQDRLIPVSIVETIGSASNQNEAVAVRQIEIVTPAGFTLRVDQGVLPQRLAALLDVIAQCRATGGGSC